MGEEKKHIDRVFQERLKDFEVLPDPKVWKNIEQELKKKEKRRIVPLWLRFGSAAAILLFLASTSIWYLNKKDTPNDQIETPIIVDETPDSLKSNKTLEETVVSTDSQSKEEAEARSSEKAQEILKSNFATMSNSNKKANQNNKKEKALANEEKNLIADNIGLNIEEEKVVDNEIEIINKNKPTAHNTELIANNEKKEITKKDITQAIEDNLKNTLASNKEKEDRWFVGPVVAPIQYNSFSKGSPVSKSLASNDKRTNTTLAYGLKINYKLNDRLSIQSGINSVDLSYRTKDVTAFVFSNQLSFSNNLTEEANIEGSNTVAVSDSETVSNSFIQASRGAAVTLDGDLNQSISYVEIPFEAKYALTKTKLGINIVGGVSTYILNENNISLSGDGSTKSLGKATNINNVNFSGNLGLDFDYKINKKIFINVSPMFKYQMNTFSKDDGGFNPYFLGVYTGLNFRF